MMRKIFFILITLCLFACKDSEETGGGAPITSRSEIGFYSNNTSLLVFDEMKHQYSLNRSRLNVRIQSDDQSIYVNCKLSTMPKRVGEEFSVQVSCKGVASLYNKAYKVTVESISGSKYWLWSADNKTGFVLSF